MSEVERPEAATIRAKLDKSLDRPLTLDERRHARAALDSLLGELDRAEKERDEALGYGRTWHANTQRALAERDVALQALAAIVERIEREDDPAWDSPSELDAAAAALDAAAAVRSDTERPENERSEVRLESENLKSGGGACGRASGEGTESRLELLEAVLAAARDVDEVMPLHLYYDGSAMTNLKAALVMLDPPESCEFCGDGPCPNDCAQQHIPRFAALPRDTATAGKSPMAKGVTPLDSEVVYRRVMAKVTKTDTCWLWKGRTSEDGYGLIHAAITTGKRQTRAAHRVVYEHDIGAIPEGLVLDHLCRVPACVNPAHLEPVTDAENRRRGLNHERGINERYRRALERIAVPRHTWSEYDFEEAQEIAREALGISGGLQDVAVALAVTEGQT